MLNHLAHTHKTSAVLYHSLIPGDATVFEHGRNGVGGVNEAKSNNDSINNRDGPQGSVHGGLSADWPPQNSSQHDQPTDERNGIPKVQKITIFVKEIVMQID